MTNEEKRNIYNNIQNLYNMDFTTWQEVLAQLYNLVADIDQKFDAVKEQFELMLGKEVANKLEEMYNDGSLEKLLNTQTLERIKQELLQIITTNKTEFDNFKNEINEQLDTITTLDYESTSILNIKERFEDNFVNVKDFGAKGDGVTDDTQSIQNALFYCLINTKRLLFPDGTYIITKPLLVLGADVNGKFGNIIVGVSRGGAIIKKTTNSKLNNNQSFDTNSIIIFINNTVINGSVTVDDVSNITLSNIQLDGSNVCDYGICMNSPTANCRIEDIKISGVLDKGVYSSKDNYLNIYERIRVDGGCNYGFYIAGGTNTSINLKSCYAQGNKNAYKIEGIYMQMDNCCADGITDTVFDLEHFNGVLNSPGSESSSALCMFKGGIGTNVVINGAYTWGNYDNAESIHIKCGGGANMLFVGGRVLFDRTESGRVSPGALFTRGNKSKLKFINTDIGKYTVKNTYKEIDTYLNYENENGSVNGRYSDNIAFIGKDTRLTNGFVDDKNSQPELKANAIYMGLGNNVATSSSGRDLQWNTYTMKGDILLSNNPVEIGGIGWIQGSDVSSTSSPRWTDGTYLKIPVVMGGKSDGRPSTNLTIGQMYLDTTIIKPIWWTGSRWIDANGTTV